MIDYKIYSINIKEKIFCFILSFVLAIFISYLFYKSIYSFGIIILIFPIVLKRRKIYLTRKRSNVLLVQFKECMYMIVSALSAGYSIENAFMEANNDCILLFGEKAYISMELQYINMQVKLNVPIEKLLMELAKRSNIEEIQIFSEVFGFAKRSGGDLIKILKNTAYKIGESIEVKDEIEILISSKKLEQNIMNIVPMFILLYINITSKEFLNTLYGNIVGICIMSVCLVIYIVAYFLSQKIMDIKI